MSNENILNEEKLGFVHTRLLLEKLKQFQNMNISFEKFYPQLKNVFETNVEASIDNNL